MKINVQAIQKNGLVAKLASMEDDLNSSRRHYLEASGWNFTNDGPVYWWSWAKDISVDGVMFRYLCSLKQALKVQMHLDSQ